MKKINLIFTFAVLICIAMALSGCIDIPESPVTDTSVDSARYDLNDDCFVFESYGVVHRGPNESGELFSVFESYTLQINGRCITSADEIVADISLYDAYGKLLGVYKATRTEDVQKDEIFTIEVAVKDSAIENTEVVMVDFYGVSIKRVYMIDEFYCNVTYVFNNGSEPKMIVAEVGDYLEMPLTPEKDGHVFDAWYTDPEFTNRFKPYDMTVSGDMVLYAKYMIDYVEMSNRVVEVASASTVHIRTKSYSSILWGTFEVTSHEKEGEGVIIKDDAGYYYVMTTNDMVCKKDGYENVSYTVVDCEGNEYSANLKHSGDTYNLGVLYFKKNPEVELGVVKLAASQPKVGDRVAILIDIIGGQRYSSFGDVLNFEKVKHQNTGSKAGDMIYEMMIHDAKTDRNVTGRPMLDMNLNLVGIQCGTFTDKDVDIENPHVIPWSVIKKYIDAYGI